MTHEMVLPGPLLRGPGGTAPGKACALIVQIPWQMSGGRHDDRPWPPPYTEFEVPDWEGRDLIAGGNAMFVRDSAVAKPAAAPVPAPPVPVPDLAPAPAAEKPAERAAPAEEKPAVKAEEKPAPVKAEEKPASKLAGEKAATAPAPSEPKAAWVEFAVSRGANEAKANEMSKADLMSRYGGRL